MNSQNTKQIRPLTRQTLRGVWCALITPWTDDDRLDEERYRAEIRGYADTGIDGIYTGGTTGEYYAQDDATFERVTAITCEEGRALGLPVQIGCTTLSTRTARQRIGVALKHGADGIQIALPFWLEMQDDEVITFTKDVAAEAGKVPIILYLTSRSKRKAPAPLLAQLADAVPTFIGTKDTGCTLDQLKQMVAAAPDIAIFGGDVDFYQRIPLGGKGGYCSVTGLNARLIVKYYRLCADNKLGEAQPIHDILDRFMTESIVPMVKGGLWDSAIDRMLRVAGGMSVGLRCQRPYKSCTPRQFEDMVGWLRENAPEVLPASVGRVQ